MKLLLLYLLLLLPGGPVPAGRPPYQLPPTVAGIQAELRRPGVPDSVRVMCYNGLTRHAQTADPAAANRYVQQALAIARRSGFRRGEANALLMQGSVAIFTNDALRAQTSTLQALRLFEQLGNRKGVASALQSLGSIGSIAGDTARALRYYLQADSAFKRVSPRCAWCEVNLLANLAENYQSMHRFADAERTCRQVLALSQGQDDSYAQMRVTALSGLASALNRRSRPDSAVALLHQGIGLAHRIGDSYLEASLFNALAQTYGTGPLTSLRLKEYYARQAVHVAKASSQPGALQVALRTLADALHQQHRAAAYDTLLSYVRVSQQMQAAEHTKALLDAQTRYDVAGQQTQIRQLRQDRRLTAQAQELTRLRTRQERAGLGALTALLLLLAGGGSWQYRRRQQAARLAAATALRQRLAADLHDDVGNLLTQISMHSSLLRETPHSPTQTLARLDALASASRQASQQMSDVVWGLDAKHLTLSQLLARMRDHAQEMLPPAGLDVRFQVPAALPDLELAPTLGQNLYLIYKEALHNVVKHAQATVVTVQLAATAAGLTLTVADDGRGYDGQPRPGGHGLTNMQARAQAVGGAVRYEPLATGFAVVVTLPLG